MLPEFVLNKIKIKNTCTFKNIQMRIKSKNRYQKTNGRENNSRPKVDMKVGSHIITQAKLEYGQNQP